MKQLIDKCIKIQLDLKEKITLTDLDINEIKLIAGCDVTNKENLLIAVFSVFDIKTLQLIELQTASLNTSFPYIPGLLAFRELPVLLKAYYKLINKPDLIICDGHGISHMRSMGIATMLGLKLKKPTIGCAKKRLYGNYIEPLAEKTLAELLTKAGEVVGYVYRHSKRFNPIFISAGNLITLKSAKDIVLQLMGKYKLPLPTHYAHHFLTSFRKLGGISSCTI